MVTAFQRVICMLAPAAASDCALVKVQAQADVRGVRRRWSASRSGCRPQCYPMAGARLFRAFSGRESDLPVMRLWLKLVLSSSAVLGDVLSNATELGAKAIKHTASGYSGGFAVELFCSSSCVRVTVSDAGSLGEPHV
jgi:hypothetical protein